MCLKSKAVSAVLAAVLTAGSVGAEMTFTDISVAAASASEKLAAPKNLKVISKTDSVVILSWSRVSGAFRYRIYMYDSAKKAWLKEKDVKGTACAVENLEAGTKYKFRVCALKADYEAEYTKYVKQKMSKAISVRTKKVKAAEYEVGEGSDFEYKENGTGVTVTRYNGEIKNLIIPDTIGGKKVTALEGTSAENNEGVFHYGVCEDCTGVKIPDGVTEIGVYAFCGCSRLTKVTIPDSVTSVCDYAFHGCKSLKGVKLPKNLREFGEGVFSGCSRLADIELPNGLVGVPEGAFSDCDSLTSITIPTGVTEICNGAFAYCDNLKKVTIPESVTEIHWFAFAYTPFCKSITKGGIAVINNILFYSDNSQAYVTIPDGVTKIGDNAFAGCSNIMRVTIPDSVTEISDTAFDACSEDFSAVYKRKRYTGDNIDELYAAING